MEDTLILTPSALFAFLSQIDELKDKDIQVEDNGTSIQVTIDGNKYTLQPGTELAEVDPEVVDTIDEINEDGYAETEAVTVEDQSVPEGEAVEGGLLKEIIKTLAIGGLVRMTKNALIGS